MTPIVTNLLRAAGLLTALLALSACSTPPTYDVVIRHGTIYDGTGTPGRAGD